MDSSDQSQLHSKFAQVYEIPNDWEDHATVTLKVQRSLSNDDIDIDQRMRLINAERGFFDGRNVESPFIVNHATPLDDLQKIPLPENANMSIEGKVQLYDYNGEDFLIHHDEKTDKTYAYKLQIGIECLENVQPPVQIKEFGRQSRGLQPKMMGNIERGLLQGLYFLQRNIPQKQQSQDQGRSR